VQDPQVEVLLGGEQLARNLRLGFAGGRKVDVLPPGEEVEVVPGGTAVT